ncbi:MAG: alpha/beta fold hydrolase [Pseudomonadota bacterium]
MSLVPWMMVAMGIGGALVGAAPSLAAEVTRRDFRVTTADGIGLAVREVRPAGAAESAEPLILVHGARVPGLASFDLDAAGGSLAADLARRLGRVVFVLDARGYGGSDRPEALSRPARESRPLSRAFAVVRDIDAVVDAARERTGAQAVGLLGWATGGMWSAYYASLWPEKVNRLIVLNALYGGSDVHPMLGSGSANADPEDRRRFNRNTGGYALYERSSLFPVWDRTIPIGDKSAWRDPVVAEAYGRAALASDPESQKRVPATFRAPLGAIEDSFYQASGRRLFDAASISAHLLVFRAELDFWSRPEDVEALVRDASRASSVEAVSLPQATHFVHLDRPERGRDALLTEIHAFFARTADRTAMPGVER